MTEVAHKMPQREDQDMDNDQRKHEADEIREAREIRGWSYDQLADEAGVSPKTVKSIEAGNNVRPGSLAKVRKALSAEPAAERLERETDDPSVHAILEVVRLVLNTMTAEEREQAAARIVRALVGNDTDNS